MTVAPTAWRGLLSDEFDPSTIEWQDFRSGVDIFPLYDDGKAACSSALLRYHPGARIPAHLHQGAEFLMILKGSQSDNRGHYPRGTLLINPPDTSHQVASDEGCIVLAVWEKPVKFLGSD